MPKLRSTPQDAHRKAVESTIKDVVGYMQEVLGQKLVAHIAGVADPRTVAAGPPASGHRERSTSSGCAAPTKHSSSCSPRSPHTPSAPGSSA